MICVSNCKLSTFSPLLFRFAVISEETYDKRTPDMWDKHHAHECVVKSEYMSTLISPPCIKSSPCMPFTSLKRFNIGVCCSLQFLVLMGFFFKSLPMSHISVNQFSFEEDLLTFIDTVGLNI